MTNSLAGALPNEKALLATAVAEPAAFAAIYDHYFPRVYNYVRYRVADPAAVDDLAAKIFEKALVYLSSYRAERAPFAVWLFTIARNTVNDYLRAQKRHRWLSLEALGAKLRAPSQPEEVVIEREAHGELLRALSRLGDRERDLLALKFAVGLTNRRIAELTGLSVSNVGVILYRTIRRLRAELLCQEENHGA